MIAGLNAREPPVHWSGIRYYAGLSLVDRTWHIVGTQLTIAEQTQGKKLKLLKAKCEMKRTAPGDHRSCLTPEPQPSRWSYDAHSMGKGESLAI